MASGTTTKYVPNRSFARRAMKSEQAHKLVGAKAEEICERANGMYGAQSYMVKPPMNGKVSVHALVYTGDEYAIRSNALHNTLQKSIR